MRPPLAVGALAAGSWTVQHLTSPVLRTWRPGAGESRKAGQLQVRTFGCGKSVIVLLHGMAAAGNCFGAGFDQLGSVGTVVVPDLLGFGNSADGPVPLTWADHLTALNEMLDALGLSSRPLLVAGHSMGGALALRWAAEHIPRTQAVVTFCAALYRNRGEADAGIRRMGLLESFLAGDGPLPRAACAWMCRFRTTASWLSVALRPELPIVVARSAVKHTWDSYNGSLNSLIYSKAWEPALRRLAAAGVPVTLAEAAHDPVPVPGRARKLAAALPGLNRPLHPAADHMLPLADGAWCAQVAMSPCSLPSTSR